MWIFSQTGFISIVAHRSRPGFFCVRGRRSGEVARFLGIPTERETVTPVADYRFRVVADHDQVAQAVARAVARIDYPNFKNAIKDDALHHAAARVWSVMYEYQHETLFRGLSC